MDEKIILSSCEILHIIGTLGIDEFYGIEDGFGDMSEFEIETAIISVEDSLLSKGYAELDFDGKFSVTESISDILLVCTDCDKYLDVQIKGLKNIRRAIYCKGEKIVELEEVSPKKYSISFSNIEQIKNDIFDNLNWISEKYKIPGKYFFTQSILKSAKSKIGFGSEEELTKECNNQNTAKVIANGLNGNSNYYSFTLFNFMDEDITIDSLMVLNTVDGSLEMETDDTDNNSGLMAFKPIDYEMAKTRINDTVSKLESEAGFN